MKIDIVTDEREFHSLENVWNTLLSRSKVRNIFLTFEWLSTWWKHFGHRHRLFVLVVRTEGEIVALFPLMSTYRDGFRQLGMISHKITYYKDFIIDQGQDRERVLRAILGALVNSGGWDILLLNGFPEDSLNLIAFKAALSCFPGNRAIWRDAKISLYIPFEGTYENYFGNLKKSFQRNMSKRQRLLFRENKSVSYENGVREDQLDDLIDKIIDYNTVRWTEEKGQYGAFDDPSIRSFYKDLAHRLMKKGWLEVSTMYIDQEIASMNLSFRHGGTSFSIIHTYDSKFSRYSPGNLHSLYLLEKGFVEGMSGLDHMAGAEPYKYNFNPRERKMYKVGFFSRGAKAYLAYQWFFGIRPYLERMEQSPMKKFYWRYRKMSVRKG